MLFPKYKLIRSNKKNLSLQVKQGELIVKAPNLMPQNEIENFIIIKQKWINKHINKKIIPQNTYKNNDKFLYLGIEYSLILKDCDLYFDGTNFIGRGCKANFLNLYKQHFAKIIQTKLPQIASEYNFKFNQVRLKSQKTLWGSCSGKNNLNFNYLLMMAPLEVIESVIIHELCHTIHKNHSKKFWDLVYKIMPDYKINHKYLKDYGNQIVQILY